MLRVAVFSLWAVGLMALPISSVDAPKAVQRLAARCEQAQQYSFRGELLLEAQPGAAPVKVLARAGVAMSASRPDKFLLKLTPAGGDSYTVGSNGRKRWTWVPKLDQYSEQDAGSAGAAPDQDLVEKFARQVIPTLARLARHGEFAEVTGWATVRFDGKKRTWPQIRVKPRPGAGAGSYLAELTMDPESLAVGRLVWTNITYRNDERLLLRLTVDFDTFDVGGEVSDSTFEFQPPRKAARVEAVPIPGQTSVSLLDRPAPELESRTIDGARVRLSDFRGRPVLLSFWASASAPCLQMLPLLKALDAEYQPRGLVILGVNDEGRPVARHFAKQAGLNFATLDDSSLRARHLFQVRHVPSLFLIDRDGKVVRFLVGAQDADGLREALKAVGL
jgi:peroxiredoxin/outer membrane lipoprotein-sorting protein